MIFAIIPAHNESEGIVASIESVAGQVDQVIGISDNSTDDTVARAQLAGARVVESVNNTDKKACALSQVLKAVLGLALTGMSIATATFLLSFSHRSSPWFVGARQIWYHATDAANDELIATTKSSAPTDGTDRVLMARWVGWLARPR